MTDYLAKKYTSGVHHNHNKILVIKVNIKIGDNTQLGESIHLYKDFWAHESQKTSQHKIFCLKSVLC